MVGMGWLGWTLLFAGLALAALGLFALLGLRLWRGAKALGRELRAAGELAAKVSVERDPTHSG
jgi:hypothetical protein